jgi:AcrR family transcriptional regulator
MERDSRARIRDAALKQFAALGFKGATIRQIAQEAGVSPGRVQHHFPSKQALRQECDEYVLRFMRIAIGQDAEGSAATEHDPLATVRVGRARLFLAAERLIGEEMEAGVRSGLDEYQRSADDI